MVVNGQVHVPTALPKEKEPPLSIRQEDGGPHSQSEHRNFLPLREIELQFLCCPDSTPLLHLLEYTGLKFVLTCGFENWLQTKLMETRLQE
jgi:hypothetical protein